MDGELSVSYQPIVDLSGDVLSVTAFHARMRDGSGAGGQGGALSEVRRLRGEVQFDREWLGRALSSAPVLAYPSRVHVDVHVATLERDGAFPAYVETAATANGFDPALLTLELVGLSPHFDAHALWQFTNQMRILGVRVAIDHAGDAGSSHRVVVDVHPDYFRIDRYFVIGCATDPFRASIIRAGVQIASDFGATVIAGGIETDADLNGLRRLGVTLGEGPLFDRPGPHLRWAGAAPSRVTPFP